MVEGAILQKNYVLASSSASIRATALLDHSNESSAHDKSFAGWAVAHPQKLTENRTLTLSKNRQVDSGKYKVFPHSSKTTVARAVLGPSDESPAPARSFKGWAVAHPLKNQEHHSQTAPLSRLRFTFSAVAPKVNKLRLPCAPQIKALPLTSILTREPNL